jgi:hypothetical protein
VSRKIRNLLIYGIKLLTKLFWMYYNWYYQIITNRW